MFYITLDYFAYFAGDLIVVYQIPEGKGNLVADPRFYAALKKDKEQMTIENTDKKLNNYLMVEKYRPPTVGSILLPNAYKSFFDKIVESGNI